MNYEAIKKLILEKLQDELPQYLSYHSVSHVKDVLDAVERIAREENVDSDNMILLKTAAVFHDSGFLFGAAEHERKSCELARQYLPDYGYSAAQIDKICGMIMATKIPQTPRNLLEEILADADLDYLGRDDFFSIANRLFTELAVFGIVNTEKDWNKLQVRFLEDHHYFTQTAIRNRKARKQQHLEYLKKEIEKYDEQ